MSQITLPKALIQLSNKGLGNFNGSGDRKMLFRLLCPHQTEKEEYQTTNQKDNVYGSGKGWCTFRPQLS